VDEVAEKQGGGIDDSQRWTRTNPCPVCGGHKYLKRHTGQRCAGYESSDGRYFHCMREPAGSSAMTSAGTYPHLTGGQTDRRGDPMTCLCGRDHRPATGRRPDAPKAKSQTKSSASVARILREAKPDRGRVAAYLKHRGLSGQVPAALLFHPALGYYEGDGKTTKLIGSYPAIVMAVCDATGKPLAQVHRVYLDPKGAGKADVPEPKKLLGQGRGGAIHLVEPADVLALAEGPETGMAVLEATGTPTWSAISGPNLAAVEVPDQVKTVELWGDADAGGEGQRFALAAAARHHTAGRRVYVLLPPEGRDWLDVLVAEGADALVQARQAATEWKPEGSQPEPESDFIRASDLVAEPEEVVDWIVDGLLPAGGLSLNAAKPKAGKSTTARALAAAVARGAPFLGRATKRVPVLVLALEEKRADVREHFRRLGVSAEDALFVHVGPAPAEDPVAWLRTAIRRHGAGLVILDPLARFVRAKDMGDYAELTRLTEPLIQLAHETGGHLHCSHHARKGQKGEESGIDAVLGSTQLAGFVDTVMILKRHPDGLRTLESVQRTGTDLPETVLVLDPKTGRVEAGGEVEVMRTQRAVEAVVAAVREEPEIEDELEDRVGGDHALFRKALRQAVSAGRVTRTGGGLKGDPYRYSAVRANNHPRENEQYEQYEKSKKSEKSEQVDSSNARTLVRPYTGLRPYAGLTPAGPINPFAAAAPAVPCPMCREVQWWQQAGGAWVCGRCHAPPGQGREVGEEG